MTEKLKTLLDRAADVEFAAPDLDSITSSGNRAVRRRRLAVGAGGLTAAAVTATGVLLVAGGGGPENRVADASSVDAAGMSWAVGSVLHTPTSTIDVGRPVRAYVRTTAGFVTVDDEGTVWSVVGNKVTAVGRMAPSSLYLAGDTEDSLAAWLEPGDGNAWRWVVLDQATGRRALSQPAGNDPDIAGVVVDLDARQLYVSTDGRYVAIDVDDGTEAVVERPVPAAQLLSVEDGVFAWADPGDDDGESEYFVGRTEMEPVRIPAVQGTAATFSPDARWVSFDADEPRVFDVATGDQVEIELDGRIFGTAYEWLDDDTVAVLAGRTEVGPAELLACDVPSGACGVVAPDLGTFDEALEAGIALPIGSAIDE